MKINLPIKVNQIIEELKAAGYDAYAVGGCVRDSLLGRNPEDWDITTSANPYQVKEIFPRTIDTGIQHGTVTVMLGKEGFEVTMYRVDGEYEDNRHPKQVIYTTQLVEDLKRRDFTINAMAYNEEAGLVDEFNGLKDLEEGCIRCVGSARERFEEDALRILRAIRFAAQLDFTIDEETLIAIKEKSSNLTNISAERIRDELNKLLLSGHPKKLLVAQATKITSIVLPEFDEMLFTEQQNHHHIYTVGRHCMEALHYFANKFPYQNGEETKFQKKQQIIMRWAILLHDVGKPRKKTIGKGNEGHFYGHGAESASMAKDILRRLKFDNETIDYVVRLIQFHDYRYETTPVCMRRAVNKIGTDLMEMLFELQTADIMAQNPDYRFGKLESIAKAKKLYYEIIEQGNCVSLKTLAVNGSDLIAIGFQSGKEIGQRLSELLDVVLEHPEYNEKETLLEIVKKRID